MYVDVNDQNGYVGNGNNCYNDEDDDFNVNRRSCNVVWDGDDTE